MPGALKAGMSTLSDAADFVRTRLHVLGARVSQDEMQSLVKDLRDAMGRTLTASEVNSVVAAFQEIALPPQALVLQQQHLRQAVA
jgi:hypothetical protein